MEDFVNITVSECHKTLRPANPAHWVVIVTQRGKEPWEFIRGGIVTKDSALGWCYDLADDYPDAVEVCAYELDRREYAQRMARA
jgi:hypothetical protein